MKYLSSIAALLALMLVSARADDNTSTIKFSDPSKPGTVKISVARGSIRIHGDDSAGEVKVRTEATPEHATPRKDGLRVLTVTSSYAMAEKDNVVTIDAISAGWMGGASDFDIAVPKNSNVVISNAFGGDIVCADTTGDIDIRALNGQVRLENIVSGAIVETTNGEISATIRELRDKPVSFTSMNGAVSVHVPETAKANIRLRTQNGTILTDFDEKELVTKVEALPGRPGHMHGALSSEMRQAVREAARASAEATRAAAEAIREAAEAAREGVDAGNVSDSDSGRAHHHAVPPVPGVPAIPAIPSIPAMTGGKLVSGTLNGGGPEINVVTMNGDVILRKTESK